MSLNIVCKNEILNGKTNNNENHKKHNHSKIIVDKPLSKREFGKDLTNIDNCRKSVENINQTLKIVEIRNNIFNKYASKVPKDDSTKFKKDLYNFRPRTTLRAENNLNISVLNSRNQNAPSTNGLTMESTNGLTMASTNPSLNEDKMDIDIKQVEKCQVSINPFDLNYNSNILQEIDKKSDMILNSNPQLVDEFIDDIFEHIKAIEKENQPKYGYMKNQTDINEKMRAILIDWLVEVHLKFKLVQETLFLTINIIDRFLEKKNIMRNRLQLVGVTAMLISCKYEEIYAPEIRDFVYITDKAYTKDDILAMENEILSTLQFNITVPTSFRFLEVYSHYLKLDDNSFMFVRYLLELFLIEYRMIKYLPSILSASSIYIALKITKKIDANFVPIVTNYSEEKLRECAKDICIILDNIEKSSLQAIRKKFSLPKFLEVAKIKLN